MSFSKIFVFFFSSFTCLLFHTQQGERAWTVLLWGTSQKVLVAITQRPPGRSWACLPFPSTTPTGISNAQWNWTKTLCREQDKVSLLSLGLMSCTLSVYCALYTLPILGYPWKGSTVVSLLGPALYSDSTCLLQEFICSRLHCWWSVSLWYWSTSLG